MLRDVLIASSSSAGVKVWWYFSKFLNLKLSFCFSTLILKVRKCGLELLREEFAENVSANVSAMSFLVVASVLFFVRCLRAVGWSFPEIFLIVLQIVFVLVKEPNWLTVLPTFLLGFFSDFSCFCPENFESVEVGSLLNFRKAVLHRRIAVLQSSLNQRVLCLFAAGVFAIVSFVIKMWVLVKCFVWSMMLGSFNIFCLEMVLKICQFALFTFQ